MAIPGLFFLFIFVFSIMLIVNNINIKFADDWIRTADLWYQKRPLYQLSHNHFPYLLSPSYLLKSVPPKSSDQQFYHFVLKLSRSNVKMKLISVGKCFSEEKVGTELEHLVYHGALNCHQIM